ncbi:Putative AC transposase [Linum grandiflorum]
MEPVSTNQADVDDDVPNAAPPVPPPVGGAVNNENQPQDNVVILPLGVTRKLTYDVWRHFTRLFVNRVLNAKCNYCKKVLAGRSTNGTSHLRTHRYFCVQKQIHDGTQKILGPNYKAKGKTELSANQFSSDVSRKELCIMILMHEYPLSMVDHLYFKRFCCTLQPLFKVPTRNTVKKDILNLYETRRANMQRRIDHNKGRIAITTDMWTATNQKRGYMAVTGHYVDNPGKHRGHLLRFLYLPAPHTSERLAAKLSQCLLDWNIDTKLSTITLDNCTTNDAMINLVRESLLPSNLIQDGALLHMRCSAHILNLIVRDGLEVVKDGIEKIRESVVFWTCTPRRVEYFHDNAKQCKLSVSNKLVLDYPTRSKKLTPFDILNWWNLYGAKYPTLHRIAKDILAVPITSVAFKSAFSFGGRLLDPHRSRLQPSTVEVMVCCRSWIQDEVRGRGGVIEREMQQMEGIFSTLAMEDSSMEEITGKLLFAARIA